MYDLIESPKNKSYTQSPQQKQINFTFANKNDEKHTLTEVCMPFRCRDYLNDILYCEETSKSHSEVYGFRYDPAKQKIDRDRTRLILHCASPAMIQQMKDNQAILTTVENAGGFAHSKIIDVKDNTICVEGDPVWMRANFMISLYTYLLKCLTYSYKELVSWETELSLDSANEGRYMNGVGPDRFKFLTRHLNEILDPYTGVTGGMDTSKYNASGQVMYLIHDNTGFMNTFMGSEFLIKNYQYKYAEKARDLWTKAKESKPTA